MSYEDLWREMEEASPDGGGQVQRRVHPESAIDLFVALTKPDNRRMLVMAVSPATVAGLEDPPSTRGISAGIHVGPDGRSQLALSLAEPTYRDLFTALATDVTDAVAPARDEAQAVAAWSERLRRWRRLLEKLGPEGLSGERQRGLYGELWVLHEHLIPALGSLTAVRGWTGPDHASHDFQLATGAAEIKVTAGKQHQVLRIASERQLDGTGTPALFLAHLSVDARLGAGQTLPDLVAGVRRAVADGPAEILFEDRLCEWGYLDVHARLYASTAYTVREFNMFRVVEGFPRIVESDLASGVGDVHYSVTVAECKHWAVSVGAAMDELRGADER